MIVKCVNTLAGLKEFKVSWDALLIKTGNMNPFLSFEWFLEWLAFFEISSFEIYHFKYKDSEVILPLAVSGAKVDLLLDGLMADYGGHIGFGNRQFYQEIIAYFQSIFDLKN